MRYFVVSTWLGIYRFVRFGDQADGVADGATRAGKRWRCYCEQRTNSDFHCKQLWCGSRKHDLPGRPKTLFSKIDSNLMVISMLRMKSSLLLLHYKVSSCKIKLPRFIWPTLYFYVLVE